MASASARSGGRLAGENRSRQRRTRTATARKCTATAGRNHQYALSASVSAKRAKSTLRTARYVKVTEKATPAAIARRRRPLRPGRASEDGGGAPITAVSRY